MSHLSTIIHRVKHWLEISKGNERIAARDPRFRDAVRNLEEYQDNWDDYTQEEQKEADELYSRFAQLIR